jgi:hypothetical protein
MPPIGQLGAGRCLGILPEQVAALLEGDARPHAASGSLASSGMRVGTQLNPPCGFDRPRVEDGPPWWPPREGEMGCPGRERERTDI